MTILLLPLPSSIFLTASSFLIREWREIHPHLVLAKACDGSNLFQLRLVRCSSSLVVQWCWWLRSTITGVFIPWQLDILTEWGRDGDGSGGGVRLHLPARYCPWFSTHVFPSQVWSWSAGQLLAHSQLLASFHLVRLPWPEKVFFLAPTISIALGLWWALWKTTIARPLFSQLFMSRCLYNVYRGDHETSSITPSSCLVFIVEFECFYLIFGGRGSKSNVYGEYKTPKVGGGWGETQEGCPEFECF